MQFYNYFMIRSTREYDTVFLLYNILPYTTSQFTKKAYFKIQKTVSYRQKMTSFSKKKKNFTTQIKMF